MTSRSHTNSKIRDGLTISACGVIAIIVGLIIGNHNAVEIGTGAMLVGMFVAM